MSVIRQTVAFRFHDDDQGAVAVIAAVMGVVLFGMAAFAVDLGIGYASKREQSVTADAAALAGAQAAGIELRSQYPAGQGCNDEVKAKIEEKTKAAAEAVYWAQLPKGTENDLLVNQGPAVSLRCGDDDADPNAIDVTVTSTAVVDSVFGGLLGVDQLLPGAAATARVSGTQTYGGLRPFEVCAIDAEAAVAAAADGEYPMFQSALSNASSIDACGKTPAGNWGIVDFNDKLGGGGTGEVAGWTEFGYGGFPDDTVPVVIPGTLPGSPGGSVGENKLEDALNAIVGQTVMFPVRNDGSYGSGAGAEYDQVGVLTAQVCGAGIVQNPGKKDFKWTTTSTVGGCWDELQVEWASLSANDLVIQWRFSAFSTTFNGSGDGGASSECPLTDPLCVPTIRLYR